MAAVASAIWPLLRSHDNEAGSTDDGTRKVLIDQLDEIKQDRARGLLNEAEEIDAHAEVARRLLALDRTMSKHKSPRHASPATIYPWAMIVLIPVIALGAYLTIGRPELPDRPIALRVDEIENQIAAADQANAGQSHTGQPDIEELIARVEGHLAQNPQDIRGWLTLAPVYRRQGRLDDAENAYRKILEIGPDDLTIKGRTQNALGQILITKSEGAVSEEALSLFNQAKANAPDDAMAYFFIALALSQAEKRDDAIAAWKTVISRFGADDPPWLPIARRSLAVLEQGAIETIERQAAISGSSEPNPSQEDIDAARNLNTQERAQLVREMVRRLATRLDEDPDDLSGWLRLIRSYIVLGDRQAAKTALAKARHTFSANAEATAQIDATASKHDL